MMESGEKYCSNTIRPCDEKNEDEDEEKNESLEMKDGGSSSNSTVEENEKKPSVRPYVRSKMPRLRWTPELHLRFMHAVERLGGQDRATPKLVLQLMDIKGLNIAHVKSHLQMYRTKKIDESNQGLKDHRIFMEGVDRNVYNLSQLPLLPSFNQRQNSNVMRYGDASWKGDAQWMHNSAIGLNTRNITRPGFYASERMLGSHYSRSSANLDLRSRISSFNEGPIRRSTDEILKEEYGLLKKHEPWVGQFRQNPTEINSLKLQIKQKVDEKRSPNNAAVLGQIMSSGIKRKASDPEVDLNLSLGLESRNGEQNCTLLLEDEEDEDEDLVLSLKTTSSSTSKQAKKQKEDNVFSNEKGRGASTLDLTL